MRALIAWIIERRAVIERHRRTMAIMERIRDVADTGLVIR